MESSVFKNETPSLNLHIKQNWVWLCRLGRPVQGIGEQGKKQADLKNSLKQFS